MNAVQQQPRVAILIFADAQQRDLRRRGFSSLVAPLLAIPKLHVANADLHWFCDRPGSAARGDIRVHRQHGRSFGQRLENAVDDLAREGYDRVVIVGRDCPQLTADDVHQAIRLLDSQRLVIGPDHRGGCWLIALHAADRERLRHVRWQQNTDASELIHRFGESSVSLLETKIDLDSADDLQQLSRVFELVRFLAVPARSHLPLASHPAVYFAQRCAQLPPPAALAA